jgi:hypothetical protein
MAVPSSAPEALDIPSSVTEAGRCALDTADLCVRRIRISVHPARMWMSKSGFGSALGIDMNKRGQEWDTTSVKRETYAHLRRTCIDAHGVVNLRVHQHMVCRAEIKGSIVWGREDAAIYRPSVGGIWKNAAGGRTIASECRDD